ncbi:hypothetical protein KSC_085950 [Ktedonobacter sp. SOSP1-52]|nr:hypothetical protein [Ktedonobacter sp. SOSP1-52]GHO69703.1 hypothetical protein KSC_085950 [Ktedonobacter sp. SOSP1-52]
MIVFETERLAVRNLREDDFDAFYYWRTRLHIQANNRRVRQ